MKPRTLSPSLLFSILVALLLGLGCSSAVQAQQVQVTAADPPSAEQGTVTLDVRVIGKGFKNGAKAKWFITGTTDPGGVTVNSTTFVSSNELRANITVSDTAVVSDFDIQVLNTDGRGGKGTELFKVIAKGTGSGNSAQLTLNVTIEPLAGNCRICPDNSTTPTYETGVASVNAVFSVDGHFVFLSGNRTVEFLYSTPIGDSLTTRTLPTSEEPPNVRARTFNTTEPYTSLQDMFVGQQQCLGLGWFIGQFTNSERSIGFRYGRGMLTNTSFVLVQRIDLDNWVMEPAPQTMCSTTFLQDNVARIRDSETKRGKTTDYDYGRYLMPFKLTLTRQ